MKKIILGVLIFLMLSSVAYCEGKNSELKLNVYERIMLSSILPKKSNFEKAMIISDITDKIRLTQKDIVLYEIKSTDKTTTWNAKGLEAVPFTFTETEVQVLKDSLEEVNKKNEVEASRPFLEMYKKIKNAEAKTSDDSH